MKQILNKYKHCFRLFSTILLGISTVSCSMMDTDRSECPEGLYVNFVYDYNIQRADMFKDHVGSVTVYVFDENNSLVMQRIVSNSGTDAPLRTYGYRMRFTPDELPAGKYRLVALAMNKDWNEALGTAGAKYRKTELKNGDKKENLNVTLDRKAAGTDGFCEIDNTAALDTLWHGTVLKEEFVTVQPQGPTFATISLVRDTKTLNITIRDVDFPASIENSDYEVTIEASNGKLDSDNNLMPDDKLLYKPFAEWTTRFPETGEIKETTAHYDINFNRVMYSDKEADKATLLIRNSKTRDIICNFNLPYLLSEGRSAFETMRYSRQEYLDREYSYRLDLVLKGDHWMYINISVGILGWTRRIVNTEI
jgi:hypothetical protein